MDKLKYVKVDKSNIDVACRIQSAEWQNYPDRESYELAIEHGDEKNVDFIVYLRGVPIGITGVYTEDIDPTSLWLNWFCVLKEYRGKGYGKQILLDTIKYCQQFDDVDFLRVDTSFDLSRASSNLYLKVMDFIEKYTAEDKADYVSDDYICTKCLKPNSHYKPWDNRNLHLYSYYENIKKSKKS